MMTMMITDIHFDSIGLIKIFLNIFMSEIIRTQLKKG
jgi:hypothetical protein